MSRNDGNFERVSIQTCRNCASHFTYELDDGGIARVIVGPPKEPGYLAVSYVWGAMASLQLDCNGCNRTLYVPISNATRFRNLMQAVGPELPAWLDALSINQADKDDIERQVAIMGTIYKNAAFVMVLLPSTDYEAGKMLDLAVRLGVMLLKFEYSVFEADCGCHRAIKESDCHEIIGTCAHIIPELIPWNENEDSEKSGEVSNSDESMEADQLIGKMCWSFFGVLSNFEADLEKWTYWRRAWTFQEWALAKDISVSVENEGGDGLSLQVHKVKRFILRTALMISGYKLRSNQYTFPLGFSQGIVPIRMTTIRRLFPDEELFLQYFELNRFEQWRQSMFPSSNGFDQLLCLRQRPYRPESKEDMLKRRLVLMLNALGTSKREARFEADLVYCWASMCNLDFGYEKDDKFVVALCKALGTIRSSGIQIFDFQACTIHEGQIIDSSFLSYSTEWRQTNASDKPFFPGAPSFTGRLDAAHHIEICLHQISSPGSHIQSNGILRVYGVTVEQAARLSRWPDEIYFPTIRDDPKSTSMVDIRHSIHSVIKGFRREVLDKFCFMSISISALPGKPDEKPTSFHAWTIFPDSMAHDLEWNRTLVICREDSNGTLALAKRDQEGFRIISYIFITDSLCGTFLIPSSSTGHISIPLRKLVRADHLFVEAEKSHPLIRKEAYPEGFSLLRPVLPGSDDGLRSLSLRASPRMADDVFECRISLGPFVSG